jgi:succinate-acetate transporter protein
MADRFSPTETVTKVLDTTANPAPLGLMGFAMTTILLNIHNAGLYELNAMILATGIFYGGIAQLIAGILEWKKNNTFGTVAFISYGSFWLLLVALWLIPDMSGAPAAAAANATSMACMFVLWGIFSGYMFIGTLKLNRALQWVFGLLTILFFLLAIENFGGGAVWGKIAGWEGVLTGLAAMYAAAAQILNEIYRRVVLPIGPVGQPKKPALVTEFGGEISRLWLDGVRGSSHTPAYKGVSDDDLEEVCRFTLGQIDKSLCGQDDDPEMAAYFRDMGASSAATGVPLPEVVSALQLLKNEVWDTAREKGIWTSAGSVEQAIELSRQLDRFFDSAVYHASTGFAGK